MNRYMSYQYQSNNFSCGNTNNSHNYHQPSKTTSLSQKSSANYGARSQANYSSGLNSSSMLSTSRANNKYSPSSNINANYSSSSTYKSCELPWSSSLASTSKYPLVNGTSKQNNSTSSASSYNNNNSIYDNNSRYYSSSTRNNDPQASATVTSSTISGRSLFEYSSPRTAINTPASRIYDGQLRRTATARYTRVTDFCENNNKEELKNLTTTTTKQIYANRINSSENNDKNISEKSCLYKPAKNVDSSSSATLPKAALATTSEDSQTTGNHLGAGQSCVAKPFRSSSLKLRASYTNILDQLTSTTLAKLRLSSSNNRPSQDKDNKSEQQQQQQQKHSRSVFRHLTRQPVFLDVVADEPEAEAKAEACNQVESNTNLNKLSVPTVNLNNNKAKDLTSIKQKRSSPTSSSSGLSSAGIAGVSPTSSSSSSTTSSSSSSFSNVSFEKQQDKLDNNNPTIMLINNLNDSGNNSLKNNSVKDSKVSGDDDDESTDDYISSSENENGSTNNNSLEEEEQTRTLVSPVTRRLKYLNKELGADKNNLVSRDNLIKTGVILSELKTTFDDDDDDDNNSSESSQLSQESDILMPSNVNESELVIKPNRQHSTVMQQQTKHLDDLIITSTAGSEHKIKYSNDQYKINNNNGLNNNNILMSDGIEKNLDKVSNNLV